MYLENSLEATNLLNHMKILTLLMYMDDMKLFAKIENELNSKAIKIDSQDILTEFDIKKMCHANNEKQKKK